MENEFKYYNPIVFRKYECGKRIEKNKCNSTFVLTTFITLGRFNIIQLGLTF